MTETFDHLQAASATHGADQVHLTIVVDAAPNVVRRVVNRFGKIMKFDNGGYRVACVVKNADGVKTHEATFVNLVCPDQFAAECYAVLKAVNLADDFGCTHLIVVSDCIGSFGAVSDKKMRRGYKGGTYLYTARSIAAENGCAVEFESTTSRANEADGLSRSEQRGLVVVAEKQAESEAPKAQRDQAERVATEQRIAAERDAAKTRRIAEEKHTQALADPATAKHGVESLAAALQRHPNALRLTRKGCLVGEHDAYVANIAAEINWPLGCYAWLSQNNHAVTVDNRTLYFDAAKAL